MRVQYFIPKPDLLPVFIEKYTRSKLPSLKVKDWFVKIIKLCYYCENIYGRKRYYPVTKSFFSWQPPIKARNNSTSFRTTNTFSVFLTNRFLKLHVALLLFFSRIPSINIIAFKFSLQFSEKRKENEKKMLKKAIGVTNQFLSHYTKSPTCIACDVMWVQFSVAYSIFHFRSSIQTNTTVALAFFLFW